MYTGRLQAFVSSSRALNKLSKPTIETVFTGLAAKVLSLAGVRDVPWPVADLTRVTVLRAPGDAEKIVFPSELLLIVFGKTYGVFATFERGMVHRASKRLSLEHSCIFNKLLPRNVRGQSRRSCTRCRGCSACCHGSWSGRRTDGRSRVANQ